MYGAENLPEYGPASIPDTKHKAYDWQLKSLTTDGSFSGYASVFNVMDSHQDIIERGAFSRTLKGRADKIRLLWQHDFSEPIGAFTTLREDETGLYVEGKLLLDVRRAGEAYALLKAGALNGLSIGYSVVESGYDSKRGARILTDIDLWEISLVTFPANEGARITQVKGGGIPSELTRQEQRFWSQALQSGDAIRFMDACERATSILTTVSIF